MCLTHFKVLIKHSNPSLNPDPIDTVDLTESRPVRVEEVNLPVESERPLENLRPLLLTISLLLQYLTVVIPLFPYTAVM